MQRIKHFLWFNLVVFSTTMFAQIGIGTTTPNGALDINSSTQGLIVPRVALTTCNATSPIINPNGGAIIEGTIVYNTATDGVVPNDVVPGFYFWNGASWLKVTTQTSPKNPNWSLSGNAGTNATNNFIGTMDATDFIIKTDANERLRINSNGNIGIGISTPNAPLQFTNTVANRKISLYETNNNDHQFYGFGINGAALRYQIDDIGSSHIFFAGNSSSTSNELMRINGNGKVAIGTSSATAKLTTYDNSSSSSNVFSIGNNAGTYDFYVANNFNNTNFGSSAADYPTNGYSNVLVMNLGGNGHFVFGDNIGPWADGIYDNGSSFSRWRYIYSSNGTINTSDARVKSKIEEVPYGLQTVKKMNPVIYDKYLNFDKTGTSIVEIGFLAQELQRLIPNAVIGNPEDKNPMGINYAQIIPVLTKAIQEQQIIIDEGIAKNKQLENEIETLKQKQNLFEKKLLELESKISNPEKKESSKPTFKRS